MKELRLGIIGSLAVHLCMVLVLCVITPKTDRDVPRIIPVSLTGPDIDFEERGFEGSRGRKEEVGKRRKAVQARRETAAYQKKQPTSEEIDPAVRPKQERAGEVILQDQRTLVDYEVEAGSGVGRTGRKSAPEGATGHSHSGSEFVGGERDSLRSGSERGESRFVQGIGEAKDFGIIRDAIIRNVRYPERARRMGFEGKVLLSFVVLEDGSTAQIKVVASSGHDLLDEEAKRVVARTKIIKRAPYRRFVLLPVIYSLKQTTGMQ